MAMAMAPAAAIFRDRDLFVHDGGKLRRIRLSSQLQTFLAILLGLLIAFSTFSLVRFLNPAEATVATGVSDDMARLASVTEQRIQIIEERQQRLAAMLAGAEVDPALLRQIATVPTAELDLGRGGPYEPLGGDSDATFKQLFSNFKKLDTIHVGAIAVPSEKPVRTAAFTSGYGTRSDPFSGAAARHMGIDLAGPAGTPIYATADGMVSDAGYNSGGYGNLVKLDHGRGVETRYGHMSAILVSAGQRVSRGQMIGRMGSTGRSTGSHLHYEVRIEGKAVNPIPFMKSTDYLLAMQQNGGGAPMDAGHAALGGPQSGKR